jgi:hypothetical protein
VLQEASSSTPLDGLAFQGNQTSPTTLTTSTTLNATSRPPPRLSPAVNVPAGMGQTQAWVACLAPDDTVSSSG